MSLRFGRGTWRGYGLDTTIWKLIVSTILNVKVPSLVLTIFASCYELLMLACGAPDGVRIKHTILKVFV